MTLDLDGGIGDLSAPLMPFDDGPGDLGSWTLVMNYDPSVFFNFNDPPDRPGRGYRAVATSVENLVNLTVILDPDSIGPVSVTAGIFFTLDITNDDAGVDRLRIRTTPNLLTGGTVPIDGGSFPGRPLDTDFAMLFELVDTTGTVFSDESLPTAIDLADFDDHLIYFATGPSGFFRFSGIFFADGNSTRIANSAIVPLAVPEPGATPLTLMALLATGLIALIRRE